MSAPVQSSSQNAPFFLTPDTAEEAAHTAVFPQKPQYFHKKSGKYAVAKNSFASILRINGGAIFQRRE
jgi:hypothetical protein